MRTDHAVPRRVVSPRALSVFATAWSVALLERPHDHLLNLLIADLTWRPRARLVVQPVQALPHEPAAPLAYGGLRHAQPSRHDRTVQALGARDNDPRATRQVRRRARPMGQRVESHAFVVRQNQGDLRASQWLARLVDEYDWAAIFISYYSRSGQ
jgi:hypothetical protein